MQYDIPIMKVQNYTLDDIFEKRLLKLIPFYIFLHENGFSGYEDSERLSRGYFEEKAQGK